MFKSPRKRFGQNFLQDDNVIQKIIQAVHPTQQDRIVEIGPGRGALTLPVLELCRELHIIEVDRDLIEWWQSQKLDRLVIHATDALKFDFHTLTNEHAEDNGIRLIGNLPYNISTPLLFHLMRFTNMITDMHFMLQKEVVDRIVSQPGSKTYGRLSVMMQYYCAVERLFIVSPGSFYPPPKVDSAIVRLVPHQQRADCDAQTLSRIVKQAFSQRRKTLRNSLKNWISSDEISQLGLDPTARPETLPLDAFIKLANACQDSAEIHR